MPNLAALRENSARVAFDYGGATFTVYYRPLEVDDQAHQALRGLRVGGEMDAFYAQLERLVIWWDATEGAAAVPTTAEAFKRVGVGICGNLMQAILADVANPTWAPTPAPPTHSSNGSSPAASSAPAPTTTTWSPPPNGLASTPPTSSADRSSDRGAAGIPG